MEDREDERYVRGGVRLIVRGTVLTGVSFEE